MSSGKSNKMKALVKAKPEPGLWMEYVDVPEPEADEQALPRLLIHATGISWALIASALPRTTPAEKPGSTG